MDNQRQLGPPRQSDTSGQVSSTFNGIPPQQLPHNFPVRHPNQQHMQINGPVSRPANMTVSGTQPVSFALFLLWLMSLLLMWSMVVETL